MIHDYDFNKEGHPSSIVISHLNGNAKGRELYLGWIKGYI